MSKPLKGFRILDSSQLMFGSTYTLLLSGFSAEVIKIESPPIGDNTRYGSIIGREANSHLATRNRGKESIVLDMKGGARRKLFLELVKTANTVIENYKPDTMEKFGINYEILKEINPGTVFTSILGHGQDGSCVSHATFDQIMQAESGMMSITGPEGGESVESGGSVANYSGELITCIGTLMGVLEAQKTGHGRRMDVSVMDSLIFCLEDQFSSYLMTDKISRPMGDSYVPSAPIGAYRYKDGKSLIITVRTDAQWRAFRETLNQPQWYANEGWATMTRKAADYRAIGAEVNQVLNRHDNDEATGMLFKGKRVYGRISDFEVVADHPQVRHHRTIVDADCANGVTFRVSDSPILVSGLEWETDYTAAELGEDTFGVLGEVADQGTLRRLFDPVLEKAAEAQKAIYSKSK